MKDLSVPEPKKDNDPEDWQIAMMIICVIVWVFLITGVMMSC